MSAHPLETRMAHLEGAYEQISHRLDGRFSALDSRFSAVEQKIDRHFLWVIGLLVVSIVLPIAGRFTVH
jgi:hypothetical protein